MQRVSSPEFSLIATLRALRFVAERVTSYKQIRKVTFIDAIPKAASGKILRRVLRAQATP